MVRGLRLWCATPLAIREALCCRGDGVRLGVQNIQTCFKLVGSIPLEDPEVGQDAITRRNVGERRAVVYV